nr:MAG TPA: Rep protein [Cressdnaviricota sp.]
MPFIPVTMAQRSYCFTLNNPTEEPDFTKTSLVRYAIYQRERGENGTIHLQGYVELSKPQRYSYLREVLPGAHFEARKGTREQARDYCKKPDTRVAEPVEFGTFAAGGQGTRTDLDALQARIKEGATEKQIADEFFGDYLRYGSGIRRYLDLHRSVEPRNFKSNVEVFIGPPGTGKSHTAMERGARFLLTSSNYPWFDGYNGSDDILIDDFYGWIKFHHLLVLLDKYPCKVQKKGGMIEFAPKNIFITSNKGPELWYNDENLDKRALYRRIDKQEMFVNVYAGLINV